MSLVNHFKKVFGYKSKAQNLQRFLSIVVFISVVLPAAGAGWLLIDENYQKTINLEIKSKAENYIDLLQAGMTMPLWTISTSAGEPLLNSVKIDPSVLRVIVTDVEHGIFLEYTSPDFEENENSIRLKRDIEFEGEIIGSVALVYSLKLAQQIAKNETSRLLTIIVIQLVFSLGLISYFLQIRVIAPLSKLKTAASGIAGGDLKTSIPEMNNDEFGVLRHELEKMRESLQESFTTLEDRVRERTTELVDLNKELKDTLDQLQVTQGNLVQSEKLAALGSLVAGVSHELNTPIGNGLTVASSLSDATRSIRRKMNEGMTRSALDRYILEMEEGSHLVCASLEKASELVSSFKQVAVDRASANRRKFRLGEMLRETRVTLSPMFKHTPYTVDLEMEGEVELDSYPGPLGQIITNLLNNALIHAFEDREEGNIKLKVVHTDKVVNLEISDDGVGIPEENLKRIFDPFFTTKLGEGGNGLGMHIVHNIVTGVLGGSIEVISKVGEGTLFKIEFPVNAPEEANDSVKEGTE
ncbi:sensor histidine kinase [Teredinibacter sp. KSP-S5-2]|uniref:sensor histidine kinase n=1 Tax=Teredinibacter sp. KSP-S5-2 TaxID=3034506 RepID=UPI0029343791|nr:ATP-binding protein [Teredinibacter sp. KSP-S5-2]WNO08757.1 ATP-binding protein [Teredinibacter sp. KSP-S5-2]